MRWGLAAIAVFGVMLGGLGVLWLLQGSNMVHIDPILCVANCVPVTGHHPEWQIAGAVALAVGAAAAVVAGRKSLPTRAATAGSTSADLGA